MNEEPMKLVEALKRDLRERPEFAGATVRDKLGAALPTRRPYDSAVAPGYLAVGDAAGHVNPTTGGGIAGAAYAGTYAGEQAVKAVSDGDVSEENLWRYNARVMDHFGSRYAALDVYNVLSTAIDVDDLMGLLASLPGEKLAEALYEGSTSMSFGLKLKCAVKSFGYWDTIRNFYQTKSLADEATRRARRRWRVGPASVTRSWIGYTRRPARTRSTEQRREAGQHGETDQQHDDPVQGASVATVRIASASTSMPSAMSDSTTSNVLVWWPPGWSVPTPT
jgi:hypothetical protein